MYLYAVPAFLLGCLAWAGDGPFLLILAAILVGIWFRRIRRLALVAFVASPCVAPTFIGAGGALSGWFSGAAADWERGRLHPEGHTSIDGVGRYYPVAVGNDLVSVSEAVTNGGYDFGYNGTLHFWTRIAGPPTGAYLGEVPERQAVLASLEHDSFRMNPGAIDEGVLLVGGESVRINTSAVKQDFRPMLYSLVTVRPEWVALTDSVEGWPGMVVIARSTGAPMLYFPLDETEAGPLRQRWRSLRPATSPSR